jgi:hypothetical protein
MKGNTLGGMLWLGMVVLSSIAAFAKGAAPLGREAACIVNNLDWVDSDAMKVMVRGFPLFADFGLDIRSPVGGLPKALFDLEPILELDVPLFKKYLADNSSKRNQYQEVPRKFYSSKTALVPPSNLNAEICQQVGLTTMFGFRFEVAAERAFENKYGLNNAYCRDIHRFMTNHNFSTGVNERYYTRVDFSGPLVLYNPVWNLELELNYKNAVRPAPAFLQAIDNDLPAEFDLEKYKRFGEKFGYGVFFNMQFSTTTFSLHERSATTMPEYLKLGSDNYTGSMCEDPPFLKTYVSEYNDMPIFWNKLENEGRKNKLKMYQDNMLYMVFQDTNSPTQSPSRAPTTRSPTQAPKKRSPTKSPTNTTNTSASASKSTAWALTFALQVVLLATPSLTL